MTILNIEFFGTKEIADVTTLPSKIGQRNDTCQQWMEMLWIKKIIPATHLLSSSIVISEAEWDLLKPASLSSWIGAVTLSGPPINWFVHGTVGMLSHEDPDEITMAGGWVKLGWKTKDNIRWQANRQLRELMSSLFTHFRINRPVEYAWA